MTRESRTEGDPSSAPHLPVMVDEIVGLMGDVPPGPIIDATVGAGGHSSAILAAHRHITIIGIDRDAAALDASGTRLAPFGDRVTLRQGRFDNLVSIAAELGFGHVSGVLFDLGVSSMQLDQADRGFSYHDDGPLDMRMDRSQSMSAADVINGYSADRLADVFTRYGDERFARRIAKAVVAARPFVTTAQLASVVRDAIPAATRRQGAHPARRVFQAVRVEVNSELAILPDAIDRAIDFLGPGGRVAVLAYHSGEDRIVKSRLFEAASGGCTCPPALPCGCGAEPKVHLLWRGARKPSAAEEQSNPRARSAHLRAAQKESH